MKKHNRKVIKLLIELSANIDIADKIINENYNFQTIAEKIAFLKGMFDVEIINKYDGTGISEEKSIEMDYWAMLSVIISS